MQLKQKQINIILKSSYMSLLSNLLAFSSLNPSGEKQQRSASANSRFFFEDEPAKVTEPKQRVVSKSLSKMGLLSNTSSTKVDPKYRCLHRILHSFSMKVRKQYFAFFVTLETMKKNNISLSRKKSSFNTEKLQAGMAKFQQTFSIRYLKQYENTYKPEAFSKIKAHSQKAHLAKVSDQIYFKNKYRICGSNLLKHFNQLQTLEMKIDLFEGSIEPIAKNIQKQTLAKAFDCLKYCKQQRKENKNSEEKQRKPERQVSIFQIFDNMQKKTPAPVQNKIERNNFSQLNLQTKISNNSSTFDTDLQNTTLMNKISQGHSQQRASNFEDSRINLNEKLFSADLPLNRNLRFDQSAERQPRQLINSCSKRNEMETPFNSRLSLQNSPMSHYEGKTKSPFKTCQKIPNLRQSVEIDTLEYKAYQKIYKCYKMSSNYQQKPFQFQFKYESMPKMMNKLTPQQFCSQEVQDLTDKSGIFRDFKGSKVSSCFDSLSISNVVGESFARADTLINQLQKNREKFDNVSERSDISYAPYLPHDNSLSSINNKEQSNFGCDAVNFKNSLVLERESMKKTQRQRVEMFVKKKTFISSGQDQSLQLQNMQNRRKIKNQYEESRTPSNMISNNYDRSYALENNYLMKRELPNQHQYNRNSANVNSSNKNANMNSNMGNLQSMGYTGYNWEKKNSHQYNSQGKNKSFSFNSTNDIIPRRIKFNPGMEYDKKNVDDTYVSPNYSMNSSFRDPSTWKKEFVENRTEMPVRDVGMEPISKLRMKSNMNIVQPHSQLNKDQKKYININKR